jgi:hypothetical protein
MSLRDGALPSKQSPMRGDCFAKCAPNDMQTASLPLAPLGDFVWELQSATGEELRPFFGRTLMASMLDKAFKGEL